MIYLVFFPWYFLRALCSQSFFFKKEFDLTYKEKDCYFIFYMFCKFYSCFSILWGLAQFVWSSQFFWYHYCRGLWHFMSYGICHEISWNENGTFSWAWQSLTIGLLLKKCITTNIKRCWSLRPSNPWLIGLGVRIIC